MALLLACMTNRGDRVADIFAEERAAFAPKTDVTYDGWGVGFYQGGEPLHRKRPQLAGAPVSIDELVRGLSAHATIVHLRQATVGNYRAENTHPFRMRQWLFAHNGTVGGFDAIRERLDGSIPDFLRRNMRGDTDSERIFHVLLSFLHDSGEIDNPDIDDRIIISALRSTVALLDGLASEARAEKATLGIVLTNGRSLVALRRGRPMAYVMREQTIVGSRGEPLTGLLRYVMVVSDGSIPKGYRELAEGKTLTVDRQLVTREQSLG